MFDSRSGDFVIGKDVDDRLEHARLEKEHEERRQREEDETAEGIGAVLRFAVIAKATAAGTPIA